MLIVTFKNVHSFLDRNINRFPSPYLTLALYSNVSLVGNSDYRFPNKNDERSLAKNYSMSVTKN